MENVILIILHSVIINNLIRIYIKIIGYNYAHVLIHILDYHYFIKSIITYKYNNNNSFYRLYSKLPNVRK